MTDVFSTRLAQIEKSLAIALPATATAQWTRNSFDALPSAVTSTHLAHLIESCKQLVDSGGKRWRPLLLVLCAENARAFYKENMLLSADETYSLTPLIEFVHTASLIHDDIEDSSDTRRGKPAAYITYGLDIALNAASWLYFEASVCIDALSIDNSAKAAFYALYTHELRALHLGQAMDIMWHRNKQLFPARDEYTAMVRHKTGTLASLAAQLGTAAGGASIDEVKRAGQIAAALGEGFQILDDVQNLTTGNPGKKRGDDIVEGKKSLPVLLHIQNNPNDKPLIAELFAQAANGGIDAPAVEKCITLLTESGAVEQASTQGKQLITKNSSALASLFGNQANSEASHLIIDLFASMMKKQEIAHA